MKKNVETVLKSVFYIKDVEGQESEIREKASNFIRESIVPEYSGYSYDFLINDWDKKRWKANEHFVKKFPFEIEYAAKTYEISKNEISFLCLLERYLLWQWNLIVDIDNENLPMTQIMIANKLEIDKKTAGRMLNSLVEKHMLFSIPIGKECYYIVNPHIMFIGRNIHKDLVKAFFDSGYVSMLEAEKKKIKELRNVDKQRGKSDM